MSIGPSLGAAAGVFGTPLAQTAGSEVDRARQSANGQALRAEVAEQADNAAGIGATDGEEHAANDRDADGRRLWERPLGGSHPGAAATAPDTEPHLSKDATGQSGQSLDLSG